ncbi:MAG: glutamate--tRNA ligase, partial [Clostridiales bacterium]|nr:glutamate--tRNA ligase [Clostridiales bacterium]
AHTPQIMKNDEETGEKRKLSKRKDPEAAVSYFIKEGYPKEAVVEYLMTLISSGFEDWRRANPTLNAIDFPFNLKKMASSGCLFDLVKLKDVSKNVISVMDAGTVYERIAAWSEQYDPEFNRVFTERPEFSMAMVNIDREKPKPRKDIAMWSEIKDYYSYFFKEYYVPCFDIPENIAKEDAEAIIREYKKVYSLSDDKDTWFAKIKALCEPLGFTPNVKEYKKNPEAFKGHVGDVSTVIRIALTGRKNTPDLFSIMALLGKETVDSRLEAFLNA